jgi:hypothetical protein
MMSGIGPLRSLRSEYLICDSEFRSIAAHRRAGCRDRVGLRHRMLFRTRSDRNAWRSVLLFQSIAYPVLSAGPDHRRYCHYIDHAVAPMVRALSARDADGLDSCWRWSGRHTLRDCVLRAPAAGHGPPVRYVSAGFDRPRTNEMVSGGEAVHFAAVGICRDLCRHVAAVRLRSVGKLSACLYRRPCLQRPCEARLWRVALSEPVRFRDRGWWHRRSGDRPGVLARQAGSGRSACSLCCLSSSSLLSTAARSRGCGCLWRPSSSCCLRTCAPGPAVRLRLHGLLSACCLKRPRAWQPFRLSLCDTDA